MAENNQNKKAKIPDNKQLPGICTRDQKYHTLNLQGTTTQTHLIHVMQKKYHTLNLQE